MLTHVDTEASRLATPQLLAWVADAPKSPAVGALTQMAHATRVDRRERLYVTYVDGCAVGMQSITASADHVAPARQGPHLLWCVGEIFTWPAHPDISAANCRTLSTRARLLAALLRSGPEVLSDVDGDYLIALWDGRERILRVMTDRFASISAFYGTAREGSAVATSLRAVAAAPDFDRTPDDEAIHEAVTFGGFRLGGRTPLRAVSLQTPGTVLSATAREVTSRRYWRWPTPSPQPSRDPQATIEELHGIWRRSVERRLAGAERPGLHLSGGLDSRAILGELVNRGARPQTITFGTPHAEEVRYAAKVAKRAQVPWRLVRVYDDEDDWLTRREGWIYHTDGMIDLADLRHLESLEAQVVSMDVHLSGYIGDALLSAKFYALKSVREVMLAMPYYGGSLGWNEDRAFDVVAQYAEDLGGAPPYFLLHEHKFLQSTNRWTVAWRPWLSVRKPFTAYELFDFCQTVPLDQFTAGKVRDRWLLQHYPALSALPEARTGARVGAPEWARQAARIRRYAGRRMRRALSWAGVPPRDREATPDTAAWKRPDVRHRIEERLLSADAVVARIFDPQLLRSVVRGYFESHAAPTQVIGALFTFETFHRELPRRLAAATQVSAAWHDAGAVGVP